MEHTDQSQQSLGTRYLPVTAALVAVPAALGVWNIWTFPWGGADAGEYVRIAIITALSLLILFGVNTEFVAKLSENRKVSGAVLNRIRILVNLVTLICVFPLVKLGPFLLRYVLWELVSDGLSRSDWESLQEFLSRPVVEVPIIAGIYLVCLWRLVVRRVTANPFRKEGGKKGRTVTGPDGKTYGLPGSYQAGITYLLGPDQEAYAGSFANETHRLMWITETLEQAHLRMKDFCPRWEVDSAGSEQFAADSIVGKGVTYSQFCQLALNAIDGWRRWGDEERALQYAQWVADAASLMGEHQAFPVFGSCTDGTYRCFRELVDAYRKGRGSVKPSISKALEYQNRMERFEKDQQATAAKARKMIQSHNELMKEAGPAYSGSSGGGKDLEGAGGSDLDRMPARMSDSNRNVYIRTTGSGAYPVSYVCYETGDTIYIYRAVLHSGYADTDCGSFYY